MTPSLYQPAIYNYGTGNALVDAVASAGKSTVLIESTKRIKTTNACFVAFNKVIAEEIASRVQTIGSPMQACTIQGGDDGYSGYLETLVECDPRIRACTQHPELSDISCV